MNTIVKSDIRRDSKTRTLRNAAEKSADRKRKEESIAAPQADLSKRIGWLRRKAKLYTDKIEP